ncbi:MAG: protein-glutamate O-methyltransferase CheR [Candidatus Omnitrophica bacterium]|nr:protein-glutamate O-methyltransferase CheR [Candidatus Omnitrophota bacterium]
MLTITDKEFQQIRDLMYTRTGVNLKETKKPLIISRLRKRLEELNLSAFTEYIPMISGTNTAEFEYFVNAITTNETYFFRHSKQFNFLFETAFPTILQRRMKEGKKEIRIWSGASSTGEEPYSLAITAKEFMMKNPGVRVTLYASDINTEVLNSAKEGIYGERSLKELSPAMIQKYFKTFMSEGRVARKLFQTNDEIRKMVQFHQHNLLKVFPSRMVDIIFLRNVMIYFDKETKQKVVSNLMNNLVPGGYFFISLSESLNDVKSEMQFLQTGIYQKG